MRMTLVGKQGAASPKKSGIDSVRVTLILVLNQTVSAIVSSLVTGGLLVLSSKIGTGGQWALQKLVRATDADFRTVRRGRQPYRDPGIALSMQFVARTHAHDLAKRRTGSAIAIAQRVGKPTVSTECTAVAMGIASHTRALKLLKGAPARSKRIVSFAGRTGFATSPVVARSTSCRARHVVSTRVGRTTV